MTSVCGEWGPCTSRYLFSGKPLWHWSENSNIRSHFRSECDILLKEGEKNKKSVHRSVFSQCETFDESWKMGKEHVQTVTAALLLFQHVCLNRAMRHFGFLCNLPDKVSHLDNRAMKKELLAWSKIKESCLHLNTTSLCKTLFTSITPNLPIYNRHDCLKQLSSTTL